MKNILKPIIRKIRNREFMMKVLIVIGSLSIIATTILPYVVK